MFKSYYDDSERYSKKYVEECLYKLNGKDSITALGSKSVGKRVERSTETKYLDALCRVFCKTVGAGEYTALIEDLDKKKLYLYVSFQGTPPKAGMYKEEVKALCTSLQALIKAPNEETKIALFKEMYLSGNTKLTDLLIKETNVERVKYYEREELLSYRLKKLAYTKNPKEQNLNEHLSSNTFRRFTLDHFSKFFTDEELKGIQEKGYLDQEMSIVPHDRENLEHHGVHVEAKGLAYARGVNPNSKKFNIGLANKSGKGIGCCAGCTTEFQTLEQYGFKVNRTADYPTNFPRFNYVPSANVTRDPIVFVSFAENLLQACKDSSSNITKEYKENLESFKRSINRLKKSLPSSVSLETSHGQKALLSKNVIDKEYWSPAEIYETLKTYSGSNIILDPVMNVSTLNMRLGEIKKEENGNYTLFMNVHSVTKSLPEGSTGKNSNHWVGMHIEKNENRIKISYLDPMGHVINPQVQNIILKELELDKEARRKHNIQFEQPTLSKGMQYVEKVHEAEEVEIEYYKGNGYDCGIFLSYLLTAAAKKHELPIIPLNEEASIRLGQELRQNFKDKEDFQHIYNRVEQVLTLPGISGNGEKKQTKYESKSENMDYNDRNSFRTQSFKEEEYIDSNKRYREDERVREFNHSSETKPLNKKSKHSSKEEKPFISESILREATSIAKGTYREEVEKNASSSKRSIPYGNYKRNPNSNEKYRQGRDH